MAAASLGRLTLDLLVRLGSFEQGLNRAERQASQSANNMSDAFRGFGDQIRESLGGTQIGSIISDVTTRLEGMQGSVLIATAGLAGLAVGGTALAIGGLTKMSIEVAKADNEMAMLAKRAKIGIENFQIFTYAAEQLGISQDQLGSIFADVQEKLGEFSATGGGGAADFFDALKNNTKLTDAQIKAFSKTLQGKDGVEAVQILKDKLDELGASSQEQRFVFESLASDLTNLMPLFSEGGTTVAEYGEALKEAGVIKTKDAIAQSQLLAAQTQALNLQYQGAKNQLVTGFMPALVNVADAMFGTSKNGLQLQEVGEGLGSVFKGVAHAAIVTATGIKFLANGLAGMAAIGSKIAENMNWYEANPLGFAKAAFQARNEIAALSKDIDANSSSLLLEAGDKLDRLWANTGEGKSATNSLTNAILQLNQTQNLVTTGLGINTKEAEENAKAKDAQAKAAAKLAKEQENLNKVIGAAEIKGLGLRLKSSETISGGGVKAYTAQFAKMTQDHLGDQLQRFTALNDGFHQGKGGKHPVGQAFDFTVKDAAEANKSIQRIQEMAKKYGFAIKTLNEYSDPSKNATGGHVHVSVLGYKGTTQTLKDAQALISIAAETQEKIGREQQSIVMQYADEQLKLKLRFESDKQKIEETFINNPTLKSLYINKAKDIYDKDLDEYRKNEARKRAESWRTLDEVNNALTQSRINSLALITMNQKQLMNWNRSNEQTQGYSNLGDQFYLGLNAINQNELLGQQEKQTQLLSLYEEYLKARMMLSQQYAKEDQDYLYQQNASTISAYASMFGSLGELVRGYAGETSSAYTAILAIQKGANLASVLMNSVTAISAAWASAPFPYNMPAVAMATLETGALQATLQAFTPSISGMAHNGIDNIPSEGTWLLDGGERVLNPEQNKDLTRYLSDRQSANEQASSQQSQPLNMSVNNFVDWDTGVPDAMATPAGTRVVMNIIRREKTKINAMLGRP